MASYSIQANNISQATLVLRKGEINISSEVAIYFVVGENPIANTTTCALIPAGQTRKLRLPTKCNKIAVLAVTTTGTVLITELTAGVSSSCSAKT